MAIRIGKIARDLNVGVKTICDFLQRKGFEDVPVDNPNYKLPSEASIKFKIIIFSSLSIFIIYELFTNFKIFLIYRI